MKAPGDSARPRTLRHRTARRGAWLLALLCVAGGGLLALMLGRQTTNIPGGTASLQSPSTPTPALTLRQLLRETDGIADVQLGRAQAHGGWVAQEVRVRRWLLPPSVPAPTPQAAAARGLVTLRLSPEERALLGRTDGRLILFLRHMPEEESELYALAGGTAGAFEITHDRIGEAGIAAYRYWRVPEFEQAIRETGK